MKWYSCYDHPEKTFFIINHDENVGYYLYLYYEDFSFFEMDIKDISGLCANHQDDWLQDTLEIAQRQAWEDFGVPLDSWVKVIMPSA